METCCIIIFLLCRSVTDFLVLAQNEVFRIQSCFRNVVRVVLLQDPGCLGYLPASTNCPWLWCEDWWCSAFMWQVDGEPDWMRCQWRSVSIQRLLPDSHKFWQGVQKLLLIWHFMFCETGLNFYFLLIKHYH